MKQILLVEDEPALLRAMIREVGDEYRVLAVRSFEEAITVLDRRPALSAVVSDWRLGSGPSGIDLLAKVQLHDPTCARLLVSGQEEGQELAAAIDTGLVQRFLSKPWPAGELLHVVRHMVGPARD